MLKKYSYFVTFGGYRSLEVGNELGTVDFRVQDTKGVNCVLA